jgi:hypothetical protein
MSTFTKQITSSSDDAEENVSTGGVTLDSSDLEFLYDGVQQVIGLRFPSVTISKNATISAAYVTFTIKDANSGTITVDIHGQAADNASTFTTSTNDVSGRTKTTASVTGWSIGGSGSGTGVTVDTDDISSIITEITARTNWTSGNALALIFDNPSTTANIRRFWTVDGSSGGAPTLHVTYTDNASPTVTLNSPADAATGVSTTPDLTFTGTDGESNDIRYEVEVDTVNTFDSTSSGTTEYLDQHQDSTGTNFGFGQFAAVRYRGQVFTCGISGTLTTIGFDRVKGSQGVKVYIDTVDGSNFPAHAVGSELYSFTISNANIVNGYSTYAVPTPPTLTSGTKYCMYLAPWNTGTDAYADDYQDLHGTNSTTGGVTEITYNGGWSTENLCFHYATYITATAYGPLLDKISGTDTGFTDVTNGADTDPFASGDQIKFTVQAGDTLSVSTVYYWRVRGIDPSGSNTYGAWATTRSFTTGTGGGGTALNLRGVINGHGFIPTFRDF